MKVFFTVMNTTWAVVRIRPEKKFRPVGDWIHDLCDTSPVLYQLSWQGLIFTTAQVVSLSVVQIYDFHIFTFLYSTSLVYLEPTKWPALSWLVSSVGRALDWYRRGHGFKSHTGLNFFSGFIFTTAQILFITAKIAFILTSLSAVQIYDFHIFTVI